MLRSFGVIALFLLGSSCLRGQGTGASKCAAQVEFAPKLVENPNRIVTFRCEEATVMDLIESVGRQTRIPIGLVLDARHELPFHTRRKFNLDSVDAESALNTSIRGTGYELTREGDVLVITPGIVSDRERDLLALRLVDFRAPSNSTMFELGLQLDMWLRAATNPLPGYNLSHMGSTNEERFAFANIPSATTEEVADRIVQLGSKGMWTLTMLAGEAGGKAVDTIEVEPYQHYSNRPVLGH